MMNIENEIFKKSIIDFSKLKEYGFTEKNKKYFYSQKILDDKFQVDVAIDEQGTVIAKVYDLSFKEEYINYRIEKQTGEFVNKVREALTAILKDIKDKCTSSSYFASSQANRLTNYILKEYQDEPEFLWEKFPDYGVFKNPQNAKWYAIIMDINLSKLGGSDTDAFVLNVKLPEEKVQELLSQEGFYQAYHMNKKSWVSIILDDTLNDEEIINYINISHQFTEKSKEWITPSNPKYYDILNCFNDTETILWKQSSKMCVGDTIYIYVGSPYSCILYRCEVLEVDIPYTYKDDNLSMNQVMKIKLLKHYSTDEFPFAKLKKYGINAIRGPRSIPPKLSEELKK